MAKTRTDISTDDATYVAYLAVICLVLTLLGMSM